MSKKTKTNWKEFREQIVNSMRYVPDAPPDSCYCVRYRGTGRFGGDTHELTQQVLREAKSDSRRGKLGRLDAPSTQEQEQCDE